MKIEVERAAPRNKQDLIRSVLQAWTTATEHYGREVDQLHGSPRSPDLSILDFFMRYG